MRSCFIPALLLILSVPALADEGRRPWRSHGHGHRFQSSREECWVPPAAPYHARHPHRDYHRSSVVYVPVHREPRPVFIPAPPRHLPPPPVTIHIRLGF